MVQLYRGTFFKALVMYFSRKAEERNALVVNALILTFSINSCFSLCAK